MQKYRCEKVLGSGAYGEVFKATNLEESGVVAIKKIKKRFPTWEECLELKELKALRALKNHVNIVTLKELVREDCFLYFVFEYMPDGDLFTLMKARTTAGKPFTSDEVKHFMSQLLRGLTYMHSNNFFHRDIKPENLLLKGDRLAISDFGEAREVRCLRPGTLYVSTRWYRAPELLMDFTTYNSPIDIWAAGCILGELYSGAALFPGASQVDQLCKILEVVGLPTVKTWPEGAAQLARTQFSMTGVAPIKPGHRALAERLRSAVPSVPEDACDLLAGLFMLHPLKRLTAAKGLGHRFFGGGGTEGFAVRGGGRGGAGGAVGAPVELGAAKSAGSDIAQLLMGPALNDDLAELDREVAAGTSSFSGVQADSAPSLSLPSATSTGRIAGMSTPGKGKGRSVTDANAGVGGNPSPGLGSASEIAASLLGTAVIGDTSPLSALLNSPIKPSILGSPGALGASFDVDEIDALLDSVEREATKGGNVAEQ